MFCGAQLSLYPMSDRFVEIILKAIEVFKHMEGLRLETDDLSTCVIGPPRRVFEVAEGLFRIAAETGVHVVLNSLFSRGCPGEPDDPICTPCKPEGVSSGLVNTVDLNSLSLTGIRVAAQYSLYPLGIPHYMDVIYRQIGLAKEEGTYSRGKHFVTRLEDDLSRVFATLYNTFERSSKETGHVVIHATVSANSPTTKKVDRKG
ncbi:MAG: Ykof family thiamine-binding protein [Spirochaetes bacterium]|nr:Ykof family thiamine-binding protein [Spirochaetota bacterium]